MLSCKRTTAASNRVGSPTTYALHAPRIKRCTGMAVSGESPRARGRGQKARQRTVARVGRSRGRSLHLLKRGEAEEQTLDSVAVLECHGYFRVASGGLCLCDDALAEGLVADAVSRVEGKARALWLSARGAASSSDNGGVGLPDDAFRGLNRLRRGRWKSPSSSLTRQPSLPWAEVGFGQQLLRDVGEKAGRRRGHRAAAPAEAATECADEVESFLGTGHADIAQAALLLDLSGGRPSRWSACGASCPPPCPR